MEQNLEPKKIHNIGVYGLMRPASVDDFLIPEGAVTESINFSFDRIGAATIRSGMTAIGATVLTSRPCVGLFNALQGTAVAVFSNGSSSSIYTFDGSNWRGGQDAVGSVSLDGGTASVRVRFLDFGSYTIALNFIYNTYTSMRYWNAGSSRHWHNTGNPINVQNMWGRACNLGEVYKSRIYLAGDTSAEGNPSRLYYSAVITAAGIVTWAPTTDFVDINPGDGEIITGLKRYSLELLVFKPNYIYRYRTFNVDPDPLIKIGTRSNESIIEGKKGLYFFHDTGYYRFSGGYPVEISRPINDIIAAIPYSQFSNVVSWNDSDHIYWSIGNITITESGLSETWRNVIARYTESSEIWTIYSLSSDVRRGMVYNNGTTISIAVGLDNGVVSNFGTGVTDLGEPIEYRVRTKWYEWEEIYNRKIIEEMIAICEKAQSSEILYQTDEDPSWKSLGQIRKMINFYDDLSIKFYRIRFKIAGMSKFDPPIFKSLEVTKWINQGIIKE